MKYTRYELCFEGEPQNIGFMMGLDDIGIDEDEIETLLKPFEAGLSLIPKMHAFERNASHFPGSYFTESGLSTFEAPINRIIEAIIEKNSDWSVNTVVLETPLIDTIYFEDDFQAVIKTFYQEELKTQSA